MTFPLRRPQTLASRLPLLVLLFANVVLASLPNVDFDRMGKVGVAGAFAGLDLFNNSTSVSYDASTSTLLSRTSEGALSRLGSTNAGGKISAGCALNDLFYIGGSFSSIEGTTASNVASYNPSSSSFAALGSGGPNGEVHAVYCDTKNSKVWFGGKFSSPTSSVAVWDPKASSWSGAPFNGLVGAEATVLSITANSSQSSLFFAGSFVTSFTGNGSSTLNNTNNPNVPFSTGATPFTSSLVPIPLQGASIDASPSSSDSQFNNINNTLCPAGADGPGNTWLAADGSTAVINARTFTAITASGIRLGNTFQSGHGTTGFTVTSIPDNKVQTLSYIDPSDNQNKTCSNPCPLGTDSSVLYQDFLFANSVSLTGVQVQLTQWTGSGAGLHIFQLLSSGAFASAVSSQNSASCFSPNPSNATFTGSWTEKDANTNIAGTTQSVLVSSVNVGTPAAQGPSFTWIPYVSASGDYDVNLLIPGCTNFQDCASRTSVKVTVFPGGNQQPWVSHISQQNQDDATQLIYSGPIVPSGTDFVTTVTMTLDDNPAGNGQGGKYELVADRVQMILKSVEGGNGTSGGNGTTGGSTGARSGFGLFEWPLSASNLNAAQLMPNSSETTFDSIGFELFQALGGNTSLTSSSTSAITAVAHHPSGAIFFGGNFSLSGGSASSSTNIVAYNSGALSGLPSNGLNGPVTALLLDGDNLYVGGSFTDTNGGSTGGKLGGIAMYDVKQNQWNALQAGLDGHVASLSFNNGTVQVVGNFSTIKSDAGSDVGVSASGFASWDVASGAWVNSGGFVVGSLSFVGNGTSPGKGQSQGQFVAGNVQASLAFGSSGMVMLSNGKNGPSVTPLGVQLDSDVSASTSAKRRRAHVRRGAAAWFPQIKQIFKRQASSQLTPLPPAPPAPAPAVLAGAFWTNTSSSQELVIIGGNFSFSSGSSESQGVAIYDPESAHITPLQGSQINGTVRSLLVQGNQLYVGGEFTLSGTSANGLALYDLSSQQWDLSNLQPLSASSGSSVVVRSITTSQAKADTIIIAGTFAQAGSLTCQSICSFDTSTKQWNALGSGIQGEVAAVSYAGDNQDLLVASGSIALSGNTATNVVEFAFANGTWAPLGSGSDLPGPVTALAVNAANASSIFAAGRSTDGTSSFLSFWNGASWTELGSTLQGSTNITQLAMVPLQDTHSANGVIQQDRMLLVSGALADSSFGTASSALFDGQTFIPYIMSSSSSGQPGVVSSLFNSIASFSFSQRHFLAVGVVILISIAIAAGVVFLLALIGILWTLFSRRDDKLNKFDAAEAEDDDSAHHRPSSLLEHINAATRTTIMGGSSPYAEKEDELAAAGAAGAAGAHENNPFGPDASNYMRAETPSDAFGGGMGEEEMSRPAHARYSFDGSGEGELPLTAGIEVEVLDDRDPAWWYARDLRTGQEGVVPASYLY